MRILVDMDGVLVNFEQGFLDEWRKQHPEKVFVPIEKKKSFYHEDDYPEEFKDLVKAISLGHNFYGNLKPIPGAIDALKKMKAMGHEVFICTSPSVTSKTCVQNKFDWIGEHMGAEWKHQIVLTKDKTVVNGDILIDDKPRVDGVEGRPSWVHVLYDQPYNRWLKRVKRLTWDNWEEVLFKE